MDEKSRFLDLIQSNIVKYGYHVTIVNSTIELDIFLQTDHLKAMQIVPDKAYYTLDTPNLSNIFDASSEPVWKWLVYTWNYSVPEDSTVVSNINALLGDTITEVTRWEDKEWEMFAGAGPDVKEDEMRIVSLGTILGIDKTLAPAINLDLGKGLWRESLESSWNKWG